MAGGGYDGEEGIEEKKLPPSPPLSLLSGNDRDESLLGRGLRCYTRFDFRHEWRAGHFGRQEIGESG